MISTPSVLTTFVSSQKPYDPATAFPEFSPTNQKVFERPSNNMLKAAFVALLVLVSLTSIPGCAMQPRKAYHEVDGADPRTTHPDLAFFVGDLSVFDGYWGGCIVVVMGFGGVILMMTIAPDTVLLFSKPLGLRLTHSYHFHRASAFSAYSNVISTLSWSWHISLHMS